MCDENILILFYFTEEEKHCQRDKWNDLEKDSPMTPKSHRAAFYML